MTAHAASMVAATLAVAAACSRDAPPQVAARASGTSGPATPAWTFAVISDLHMQPDGSVPPTLEHVVPAVIASRPRFVVVTGDFTDGMASDPVWREREAPRWWHAAVRTLAKIRAAGIPVLPIAGNHDSYLPIYRADYAAAWRDLDAWAAPLHVTGNRQPRAGIALDAAPFSYAVDVDGVHLALANVVDEAPGARVDGWLAADLASATGARLRIVFGHVPLGSVAATPSSAFLASFGQILAQGNADAYIAGHEHLFWDDDVALPSGARIRQIVVGTTSAAWRFGIGPAARARAQCVYAEDSACCTMPRGGVPFELREARGEWFEAQAHGFTLVTVDGDRLTTHSIAVRADGTTEPFGRSTPCTGAAGPS
jgi:hypothetical protein